MTAWAEAVGLKAAEKVAQVGKGRVAEVTAIDPVTHSVRVTIQPEGVESGWIPDPGLAVGDLKIASPSQIGSQVLIDSIEGDPEHPVITSRLYDAANLPPVSPVTGKPAQPGELLVQHVSGTYCHLTAGGFFAGAGNATLAVQNGSIVAKVGGVTMTLSAAGLVVTGGPITSDHDVLAAGISGKMHVHGGVEAGAGETGAPV